MGARAVLVTGGHGNTHSAVLATGLASGMRLADATRQAAGLAGDAVAHGLAALGGGEGPVHVLHPGFNR